MFTSFSFKQFIFQNNTSTEGLELCRITVLILLKRKAFKVVINTFLRIQIYEDFTSGYDAEVDTKGTSDFNLRC